MARVSIGRLRLLNQMVTVPAASPLDVVSTLGAVQAQEYAGALWAIALRTRSGTEADVEQAIANRQIVRTWAMRGTIHIVPAADLRWLLDLVGPRLSATAALRNKNLGLDDATIGRSTELLARALQDEQLLTRSQALDRLNRGGVTTDGQRGYHLLWQAAIAGAICFGPMAGKQQTFVLLDDWVPPSALPAREVALGRLATSYFSSHGPATVADFTAWCGLTAGDVRTALEQAGPQIESLTLNGREYRVAGDLPTGRRAPRSGVLLPAFDEFMLGYRDRGDVLDPVHAHLICPGGNGIFRPTIVVDGRVVGTWSQQPAKGRVLVRLAPFEPLDAAAMRGIERALARYARFLGRPAELAATA